MKYFICLFFFLAIYSYAISQNSRFTFDASPEYPFGLPNPEAPPQITDWSEMIGECDCLSIKRNQDGSWSDSTAMIWRFSYIMNGFGVQDETLKNDGIHSGSIRQFSADSARWYVHYYSSGSAVASLPAWEGNRIDDQTIVLYKPQTAPNGMDGFYKISFTEISKEGFNWLGEWVNIDESIAFPTWKIFCNKRM